MVCSKCGKIVSNVTVFCPSCGESIDRKAQHDGLVVHSDDYYQVKDYQKRAKYVMLFNNIVIFMRHDMELDILAWCNIKSEFRNRA